AAHQVLGVAEKITVQLMPLIAVQHVKSPLFMDSDSSEVQSCAIPHGAAQTIRSVITGLTRGSRDSTNATTNTPRGNAETRLQIGQTVTVCLQFQCFGCTPVKHDVNVISIVPSGIFISIKVCTGSADKG
nr:hypothetical protein [Tanacetum cinerariifolium]